MDLKILRQQFEEKIPIYKRLEEETVFILKSKLEERGIKVHSVTSRVKKAESFIDKVQRKQSNKPFEEIHDIVGLRVACLFLSDIARIGELIRDSFTVLSEDNKIEDYETSSFGYLAIHFVTTLKTDCSGPRYDQLKELTFEIQVRTIAMEAWATISHYLDYKSEMDVPTELRRDFYALSGLFYVADKHFETFFKSRQESREKQAELFKKAVPQVDQEINLDSLTAYLHGKFPDRKHVGSKTISDLIHELKNAGYTSINDVEHAKNIAWEAFLLFEKEMPPLGEPRRKYADVGVVRNFFRLIDKNFTNSGLVPEKYKKLLKK